MKTLKLKEYKYLFILLVLIVSVFIIIAGKFYYENDKEITRNEKYNELKAIADLKTNEIVQWYNERQSEASFFSKHEMMVEETYRLVNGNKKSAKILQKSLIHLIDGNRYENIFILDTNGSIILSLDSIFSIVDSTTINLSQKVQNTHNILFSDFYKCSIHKSIHFDIIAPFIDNKNNVFATLIFRVNPNDFLYPLIQNWPTPSKSAETLILRSDGDSVIFLNELRHLKGTALKFKTSKTRKDLPGTQAVLGKVGLFEGIDYRNVAVLSHLDTIPGTGWSIVSKVDTDEIFTELYRESVFITLLVLFLILFVGSVLVWIYNSRQKNMYKELLANEIELHESQEEFRATLYSIGDGVITTDKKGLIKQLNGIAENLTGWNEKEAKGKKLEDVFNIINEETRKIVENPVKKVLKEGLIVGLANHTLLISKDGKEIPIADSGAPIKDIKGNITGVVLVFRDQTESRAQRKILKESEERFQLLFNRAPLGYQSLDFDGNFMDVNQQWIDTLGYNRDEVIGKWFGDFLVPEFRDAFRERFPIFKSQGYIHSEFEMLHKKGNRLFIAFEGRIGYNKFGEFIQTHCILQDITEQKKAKLALRESEKNLSQQYEILTTLLKNLQIGVFMVEAPSGKPLMANEAAYQLLGRGILPDINMKNIAEVYKAYKYGTNEPYPPEEMPILLGLKGESAHTDDMVVERPDGTKTQLEIFGSPIFDNNGKIWASLVSFTDITERKKVENELQESKEQLRFAFEGSNDGLWDVNLITGGVYLSPRGCEILGYLPEELPLIIKVWSQLVHPDDMNRTNECLEAHLKGEKPIFEVEQRLQMKSGEWKWILARGKAVSYDQHGKAIRMTGTHTDITDQKEAEEKLKENYTLMRIAGDKVKLGGWNVILNENRSYWSDQVAAIHEMPAGYSPLLSEGINFYAPEWHDKITEVFTRCAKDGIPYDEEMEIITASGKRVWIRTVGEAVRDENGKIFKVQGAFQDISERKLTEKELIKRENLLQKIFDILPIGLWFTDKNGKILNGNPAGVKIWGAEPKVGIEEYNVFKARRLPSGKEIANDDWALYHTITKGVTITDELLEIETFDGTKKIVLNYTAPILDKDGNIDGAIVVNNDITNLKFTEAQLKERDLLFKSLMDNSPIYIFFKDRDIKAMHLSKNYEQMLGKPLSEILGKDMNDLFPSELAKKMIEDDKKIVEEGKMVVVDEFFDDHYYTTIKFPILQENNEPILAGFTIDITDRKKVEQELVKLNEELEQRIKERTIDLENKNSELERMNKAFIGRELRIKELKDKIKELENKN